jgi:hypothetical protein
VSFESYGHESLLMNDINPFKGFNSNSKKESKVINQAPFISK